MNANLAILHLITSASVPVQLILLLLLVASVASWTLILRKGREFKQARWAMDQFEGDFWFGGDLQTLYERLSGTVKAELCGGALLVAGYKRLPGDGRALGHGDAETLEDIRRAMRVALNRQADRFENHLTFLATVGSISPYVGLFGTVWGIMNAFISLGNISQATLAMVAPGIAEALIATAVGLFAAIPAVVAYNRFTNDAERLLGRCDNFLEEFSGIIQRQLQGR